MNPEILDQTSSEIAALKNRVFTLFMAIIVISGTLTVYLYRESSLAGKDLVQAERLDAMVTQNEATLTNFVSKLTAYGEKHPDFLPVLKKYGIAPQPAAAKR
jgi:hypothetical protein